jgi:hypothetical protein
MSEEGRWSQGFEGCWLSIGLEDRRVGTKSLYSSIYFLEGEIFG